MKQVINFLLAVMLLCAAYPSASGENNKYAKAPETPDQQKLLQLVNVARTNGCNCGGTYYPPADPLAWNSTLETAAKQHSVYMDKNNYFSHTGENGSRAGDRIEALGYKWRGYGENIAVGYPSEEEVIKGWLKSPNHCKNIMNNNFKEMGVGTSGGYWTQVFGVSR